MFEKGSRHPGIFIFSVEKTKSSTGKLKKQRGYLETSITTRRILLWISCGIEAS